MKQKIEFRFSIQTDYSTDRSVTISEPVPVGIDPLDYLGERIMEEIHAIQCREMTQKNEVCND